MEYTRLLKHMMSGADVKAAKDRLVTTYSATTRSQRSSRSRRTRGWKWTASADQEIARWNVIATALRGREPARKDKEAAQ